MDTICSRFANGWFLTFCQVFFVHAVMRLYVVRADIGCFDFVFQPPVSAESRVFLLHPAAPVSLLGVGLVCLVFQLDLDVWRSSPGD